MTGLTTFTGVTPSTNYTDSTVAAGTTYYYRYVEVNGSGSTPGAESSVTTTGGTLITVSDSAAGTDWAGTFSAGGRPIVLQAACAFFAPDTLNAGNGTTWDIVLEGVGYAAGDSAPGGWAVSWDGTNLTVCAPAGATVTSGTVLFYRLGMYLPGGGFAYKDFDVGPGSVTLAAATDAATGADDIGGSGLLAQVSEAALGSDLPGLAAVSIAAQDGAVGTEAAIGPSGGLSATDTAAGTDTATVAAFLLPVSDAALGGELAQSTDDGGVTTDGAASPDVGAGTDVSGLAAVGIPAADGAVGVDISGLAGPVLITVTDGAVGSDTAAAPFQTTGQVAFWWD